MVTAVRTMRRQRTESAERWAKALARAIEHGLEVFVAADSGERFVTSASKLDTLHRSDGRSCTCEAALAGDPVCQHRAAVRFVLGWLSPDPAPAPGRACHGRGSLLAGDDDFPPRRVACRACGARARGEEPAPLAA